MSKSFEQPISNEITIKKGSKIRTVVYPDDHIIVVIITPAGKHFCWLGGGLK